jgi:uncharacterized protein (DUF2141 family)
MKIRIRLAAPASLAAALAACASAPPAPPPEPRPSGTGRLEVTVTGFRSEEGKARIAVFLDARSWPDEEEHLFAADLLPIRDGEAVAIFEDVPAGPFAVSVFHDKDEDAELDADFLGIPSEDYGFSRDARDMFGPPGFEEARLELVAGESKEITIRVK